MPTTPPRRRTRSPTDSDTRPPQMMRLKMSRPYASVPHQMRERRSGEHILVVGRGRIVGRDPRRQHAGERSARGSPCRRRAATRFAGSAARTRRAASGSAPCRCDVAHRSLISGLSTRVEQIDAEVDQHELRARTAGSRPGSPDSRGTTPNRPAAARGPARKTPSRPRSSRRAGNRIASPISVIDRDQRVAQRVLPDHAQLRHALRARRAHVILAPRPRRRPSG